MMSDSFFSFTLEFIFPLRRSKVVWQLQMMFKCKPCVCHAPVSGRAPIYFNPLFGRPIDKKKETRNRIKEEERKKQTRARYSSISSSKNRRRHTRVCVSILIVKENWLVNYEIELQMRFWSVTFQQPAILIFTVKKERESLFICLFLFLWW